MQTCHSAYGKAEWLCVFSEYNIPTNPVPHPFEGMDF